MKSCWLVKSGLITLNQLLAQSMGKTHGNKSDFLSPESLLKIRVVLSKLTCDLKFVYTDFRSS
jgi:hypothetical protein